MQVSGKLWVRLDEERRTGMLEQSDSLFYVLTFLSLSLSLSLSLFTRISLLVASILTADRMARHSGGKHLDDTKYPGLGRGRVNYGKSDPRKKKGEERLVAMIRSYGRSKVTPHSSPTSNPQEGCIRTISSRSSSSWQGVAAFLERIL